MGLFETGGMMNEIRCDEPSYLVWHWHPKDSAKGKNNREHAIRWGSSLRVQGGAVAVFVYNKKDGTYQDFIEGPYDQILKTENLPVLASLVGLAYDGGTPFQAEVFFINLANVVQVNFAIPFFDMFDPRFVDFGVPVAVRGTITFHIADYRAFIKAHRLTEVTLDDIKREVQDSVRRIVKTELIALPQELGLPITQVERCLSTLNERCESLIGDKLVSVFGIEVRSLDIAAIEIDKGSDGYRSLMSVTKDIDARTVQTQADVNIKTLHDRQRIEMENLEESLRIQREEGQYAQHLGTQSSHIGAFQLGQQAEVGIAAAHALGDLGGKGGLTMGDASIGGAGGMDPAAMMVGMAMGGAVGQNMAGMMNGMLSGLNQPQQAAGVTPPPIPIAKYYVAKDGKPLGPFSVDEIKAMATIGGITADTLVWQADASDWIKAGADATLNGLFDTTSPDVTPPPIPE